MTEYQSVILTATEIRAIEARAERMRTQAMAEMFRAMSRGLRSAFHKVFERLHRPRTA